MKFGMMWLNREKRPILQEIKIAVEYYEKKYARKAKKITLSRRYWENRNPPTEFKDMPITLDQLVLPHHIWIGEDEPPYAEEKGAEI